MKSLGDDPGRLYASALLGCVAVVLAGLPGVAFAGLGAQLGQEAVTIRGVSLRVAPADPTDQLIRPRNAPVILATKVEDGAGSDVSSDQLFLDAVVRGRLTGNGIDEEISAPLGANLEIGTSTESAGDLAVGSPLLEPGNYTVDDLRLVDSSGAVILDADPSTLTIRVIDRVVVSNLSTRTLSLDEIRERGIVIGDDNFTAFSFTFQLATESDPVNIDFDVVFPQDRDDPTADGGAFPFPPDVPGLDVPSFDVTGIILDTPVKLPGVNVPHRVFERLAPSTDPESFTLVTQPLSVLPDADFVDATERINEMNHLDRSGDLVLVMGNRTAGNGRRFTSGVPCNGWHGGLNKADSYVPFVVSNPGGNSGVVDEILSDDDVCGPVRTCTGAAVSHACARNSKLPAVITRVLESEYLQ